MRRVAILLGVVIAVGVGAVAAPAQTKDPFRPPGSSGSDLPGDARGDRAPGVDPPADPSVPGDGIARTGPDVASPISAGLVLLASGLGLRWIEGAFRRSGGARGGRAGRTAGRGVPIRLKNTLL